MYPQYWNLPTTQDSTCAIQDADSSACEESETKTQCGSEDENEIINGMQILFFFLLSSVSVIVFLELFTL